MAATVAGVLLTGVHASRPTSGVSVGTLYACSTHNLVYQTSDTGSTWATWLTATGTGLSDPMSTRGDIIVRNASNVSARLAKGAAGTFFGSDGTDVTWSTPAFSKVKITSDQTTTSATFADITSATATITTGARRCRIVWRAPMYNATSTGEVEVTFAVDGTQVESAPADGLFYDYQSVANDQATCHVEYITDVLSAGSHTLKAMFRTPTGGQTVHTGAGATTPAFFWVEETLFTT